MGDSNADSPSTSVLLDPAESLTFHLQPGASPQAVLLIRNTSDSRKVAFKVKTTRPLRYLVRPNQGMLAPGMDASIMVILQQKDCDELLRLEDAERSLSNDKFLVQSSFVDDSFYELVKTKSPKEMADELTSMWAKADKKSLANKKLRCRFVDHDSSAAQTGTGSVTAMPAEETLTAAGVGAPAVSATAPSASSDVDVSTQSKLTAQLLQGGAPPAATPPAPAAGGQPTSVDAAEISGLKKKYEELVTFTVQLTAQRQEMMRELAAARQQLQEAQEARVEAPTLRQRKGAATAHADDAHSHADRAVAPKDAMTFSLMHLIVCAILFFLIGRFY